jgi:putative DNA primase/helicase
MTDPVALLLDQLGGVRRSGTAWMARCPAHEDRHASLAVAAGDDGRALLTCHAGCTTEAVVAAIGLGMADLFPRTNGAAGPARPAPPQARDRETRYRVRMADGSLSTERIEHGRLDRADGSKRIRWERDGRKGLAGVSPSSFALYRIDDVAASGEERAVLVEGEKAADALAAVGTPALGTVTGAATIPCRDALLALADMDVVLWPDADGPGIGHMQRIAAELESIARSIVWVSPPPDAPAGWDAADASPEVIRRLVVEARPVDPVGTSRPDVVVVPAPSSPMGVARKLVADRFTDADGMPVIRAWRGGYCAWDGRCWPERDAATIRSETYSYLEHAVYELETQLGTVLKPWDPTKSKIANVIEALAAVTHLAPTVEPPAWLAGEGLPDAHDLVVTANGILHLPDRQLLPHDPRLFVGHSVPFAYDPDAAEPTRWLAFLADLWDDDPDSITLLQEMFGYALPGDTSLQKILLLVGPTRAGKGVIARVLTHLLGRHNVGAPTLAGLTTNFGLQDLIGKTLAIVSDARLGPKANVQALAERLLSVSGEDSITIDRKYKDPWTGRLGVRFMLLTNELPRFTDASGALAAVRCPGPLQDLLRQGGPGPAGAALSGAARDHELGARWPRPAAREASILRAELGPRGHPGARGPVQPDDRVPARSMRARPGHARERRRPLGCVEGLGRRPVPAPRHQADLRAGSAGRRRRAACQPTTGRQPSPRLCRVGAHSRRKQWRGPRTTRTSWAR